MWALPQGLVGIVLIAIELIDFDIEAATRWQHNTQWRGPNMKMRNPRSRWFGERGVQNQMYFYS